MVGDQAFIALMSRQAKQPEGSLAAEDFGGYAFECADLRDPSLFRDYEVLLVFLQDPGQQRRIVDFPVDPVSRVIIKGMMHEAVRNNGFMRLPYFERQPCQIARGMIVSENGKGEQGDGNDNQ